MVYSPGAPNLSFRLECPSKCHPDERFSLTETLVYEGVDNEENPRPITFHTARLRSGPRHTEGREGLRIYRLQDAQWERYRPEVESHEVWGFPNAEDPIPIKVGGDHKATRIEREFKMLRPGESWVQHHCVHRPDWLEDSYLPDDAKDGDQFKFVMKGAEVDWWDWGTLEDHRGTVVKLPWHILGDVVEPDDNGGRPKLIVPISNEAVFTYVVKETDTVSGKCERVDD